MKENIKLSENRLHLMGYTFVGCLFCLADIYAHYQCLHTKTQIFIRNTNFVKIQHDAVYIVDRLESDYSTIEISVISEIVCNRK